MLIIRLMGGLGNQMFQYALGRRLEVEQGHKVSYDIQGFEGDFYQRRYALHLFGLLLPTLHLTTRSDIIVLEHQDFFLKIKSHLRGKTVLKHYKEPHFEFDPGVLKARQSYIDGYFQSERYFLPIEQQIKNAFSGKTIGHSPRFYDYLSKLQSCHSVGVHVRLLLGKLPTGEVDEKGVTLHGQCEADYFNFCKQQILNKVGNQARFFLFSDDRAGAKSFLDGWDIEPIEGLSDFEEFMLLSKCQHHIISNSTFSWWAAWLNANPAKLVFAPARWFRTESMNLKDLFPRDWITV